MSDKPVPVLVRSYTEAEFSRDVISRWGHIDDCLIDDARSLHMQMAHLGRVCKYNPEIAPEIFEFLEGLLGRNDAISEIENAVAISFLDWPEVEERGFADKLPLKLKQTIEDQWKRYETAHRLV
jgi:hypothetical protein